MRDERKNSPRRCKTAGLQKAFTKSFLKIPEKIVDKTVTKGHVYKRRKKTAGVKNSFSGSLTSEERVEREL